MKMKYKLLVRFLAVIVIFIIGLNLCGCFGGRKNAKYPPQENINVNYNNLKSYYNNFWLTEDKAYYTYTPAFGTYFYEADGEGKSRLKIEKDTFADFIQAFAGYLYYSIMDYDEESMNDGVFRYDLSTDTKEVLFEDEEILSMFVVGDYVFYENSHTSYNFSEDYVPGSDLSSLKVFSMKNGEKITVSQNYVSGCVGVLDEKLVFASSEESELIIKEYDPATGSTAVRFKLNTSHIEKTILWSGFQITKNYTLITYEEYDEESEYISDSTFLVVDNITGMVSDCPMDSDNVTSFAAYENYLFFLESVDTEDHGDHWDDAQSIIKRINLGDGTIEELGVTDYDLYFDFFYVASDETIYIVVENKTYRFTAGKTEGEFVFSF